MHSFLESQVTIKIIVPNNPKTDNPPKTNIFKFDEGYYSATFCKSIKVNFH
jgi:hypothetical protein